MSKKRDLCVTNIGTSSPRVNGFDLDKVTFDNLGEEVSPRRGSNLPFGSEQTFSFAKADARPSGMGHATEVPKSKKIKVGTKQTHKSMRFDFGKGCYAIVELLWDAAPRTCEAVYDQFLKSGGISVKAVHGRNSGGEALFLTPTVIKLGDENTTTNVSKGDVLFGFEPKGICQHSFEDASEVAWVYHDACQPRRWVSVDGDPKNQQGPFKTVDVALNKFGTITKCSPNFYEECRNLIKSGERKLSVSSGYY